MISHMTAGIINEFVNSIGWTFYTKTEKEKIKETQQQNNLKLIYPEEKDVFESIDEETVIELYDGKRKRPIDIETIKKAPMIKNYRRWRELLKISFIANCDIPNYNIEANQKLGKILEKIKMHNFAI